MLHDQIGTQVLLRSNGGANQAAKESSRLVSIASYKKSQAKVLNQTIKLTCDAKSV